MTLSGVTRRVTAEELENIDRRVTSDRDVLKEAARVCGGRGKLWAFNPSGKLLGLGLRSREALKADDDGCGGGSTGLRVLSDGDFRCGFSSLARLRHTSAMRAGASAYLGDDGRLRRVSEALPADRSPDHLLRSEPFDEHHGSAATGTEPRTGSLSFRLCGTL